MASDKKRQQALIDLLNQMFVFAGHEVTYEDIKDRKDDWYAQWTMTTEQYNQWLEWGKQYLKKKFKWNQKMVDKEMGFLGLMYGLRTKE